MHLALYCSEQMHVPESYEVIMNVMPPIVFWNMIISVVVFHGLAWIHHDCRTAWVKVYGELNVQVYRDGSSHCSTNKRHWWYI